MEVQDLPAIVKAELGKVGLVERGEDIASLMMFDREATAFQGLYLSSFEKVGREWQVSARFMLWEHGIGSWRTCRMAIDDVTGKVTKMELREYRL